MTNLDKFIVDLALILLASSAAALLFRRWKQPVVLGYLLAGFLISPNFTWLPTVVETDSIQTWADIGIVFLMFALGLEFSFRKLSRVGVSAFVTALTVMSGMTAAGIGLGRLLALSKMDCIFLGCMLSMSSTMIILKTLEEKGFKDRKFASVVLGTLIVEDVLGIFMIIVLSTISLARHVSGTLLLRSLGLRLTFLLLWLCVGVFLIPTFLKKTRKWMNDEVLLIVSLGICFGMVVLFHLAGFSEALGAFLGGSILAGTVHGEAVEKLVRPLRDLFGAVFFVSIGMMVVPRVLVENAGIILLLSATVILDQRILATVGILVSGQGLATAVRGGSCMVQIGEFSFILANVGTTLGVLSGDLLGIIVSVSVVTILLTPFFVSRAERDLARLQKILPESLRLFLDKYTSEGRDYSDRTVEWWRYLKRYAIRTGVISAILATIYYGGTKHLFPRLYLVLAWPYANLAAFLLILSAMVPLMSILVHYRSPSFQKLWLESVTNRLPLMLLRTFRLLLCGMFIALLFYRLFRLPAWIGVSVALVVIGVLVRSDFLRSQAIAIDTHFRANFNEKFLAAQQQLEEGDWILDHIYVIAFRMKPAAKGLKVGDLYDERYRDVLILRLEQQGHLVDFPGSGTILTGGERVLAVSGRETLEGYMAALGRATGIVEPEPGMIDLRTFLEHQEGDPEHELICRSLKVTRQSPLRGKSIRNSEFKGRYRGFIIGMERGNLLVADPPVDTLIRSRDILWAVGSRAMEELILSEEKEA